MTSQNALIFFPKDFIETLEGFLFAVVAHGLENGKVLCFLRYVKSHHSWHKVTTTEANAILKERLPEYLYHSEILDAPLHAVDYSRIIKHYRPKERLQQILQSNQRDLIEEDLYGLCRLFSQSGVELSQLGITGSLLVGTQSSESDIDLICYDNPSFHLCRELVKTQIATNKLQALSEHDWLLSFHRRACELNFADYHWHERRKYNKALINGRKFDLNLLSSGFNSKPTTYQKRGAMVLQSKIIEDARGFDYPAEYKIDHEKIDSVVSFTATYTGQAFNGELIEVSGSLEESEIGKLRIVIGASREAEGHYIKVIKTD
jgi:uncharacterized protein